MLLPVPHSLYILPCVYLRMFSHTRSRASECVVMFSAINQRRGRRCWTEGDITEPCDCSLSLPASFPSVSPVPHSLAPSRMSPVVSSLSSLSLMIPCLQYPCNVLQRGKDSNIFFFFLKLPHVYVTQLHSGKLPDHTRICLWLKFTCGLHVSFTENPKMNCNKLSGKNKSKMVDQHTLLAIRIYFMFWGNWWLIMNSYNLIYTFLSNLHTPH